MRELGFQIIERPAVWAFDAYDRRVRPVGQRIDQALEKGVCDPDTADAVTAIALLFVMALVGMLAVYNMGR